jgi:hypothetical protein
METPRLMRLADQVPETAAGTLDPTPLVGDWANTNPASRGIVRVVVEARQGALTVRAFGAGSPAPLDWGVVPVESVYADGIASARGHAWRAAWDFGYLETVLEANLSQGLLIVAALNRFKDGSGRSSYFAREFYFYRPLGG